MKNKYTIKYLPEFKQELRRILEYIKNDLKNEKAALNLANKIDKAIVKRSFNPMAFQEYHSLKERARKWYRIYVGNYVIFYVVIDEIMEVRRILYKRRNLEKIV